MSEEQIIQFLQENIDYMVNNDLVLWLFRTIGWYLVKGLSYLIGLGKDLYDMTFRLVDITAWTGVDQWINEFRPLIVTLVVVSLVVLGMMLDVYKRQVWSSTIRNWSIIKCLLRYWNSAGTKSFY